MRPNPMIRIIVAGIVLTGCFLNTGCHVTPRTRTLPEEIGSVYIPMFLNMSYEPGLEELATRATVESFLADGRLDLVHAGQADAIVQGIITSFEDQVTSTESDEYPMISTMQAIVLVKLYSPRDRLHPMNAYKPFTVRRSYVSDMRRMTQTIPEDAKRSLMEAVGDRVVLEVLTGDFEEMAPGEQTEEPGEQE